jgi:hypothetical protein
MKKGFVLGKSRLEIPDAWYTGDRTFSCLSFDMVGSSTLSDKYGDEFIPVRDSWVDWHLSIVVNYGGKLFLGAGDGYLIFFSDDTQDFRLSPHSGGVNKAPREMRRDEAAVRCALECISLAPMWNFFHPTIEEVIFGRYSIVNFSGRLDKAKRQSHASGRELDQNLKEQGGLHGPSQSLLINAAVLENLPKSLKQRFIRTTVNGGKRYWFGISYHNLLARSPRPFQIVAEQTLAHVANSNGDIVLKEWRILMNNDTVEPLKSYPFHFTEGADGTRISIEEMRSRSCLIDASEWENDLCQNEKWFESIFDGRLISVPGITGDKDQMSGDIKLTINFPNNIPPFSKKMAEKYIVFYLEYTIQGGINPNRDEFSIVTVSDSRGWNTELTWFDDPDFCSLEFFKYIGSAENTIISKEKLDNSELDADGRAIQYRVDRPAIGYTYGVQWVRSRSQPNKPA